MDEFCHQDLLQFFKQGYTQVMGDVHCSTCSCSVTGSIWKKALVMTLVSLRNWIAVPLIMLELGTVLILSAAVAFPLGLLLSLTGFGWCWGKKSDERLKEYCLKTAGEGRC